MSFPNPVVTPADRFNRYYTASASGINCNDFSLNIPQTSFGPKYEIALISADIPGFKVKRFHSFYIECSNVATHGHLYTHSGKYSSTEDNVLDLNGAPQWPKLTGAAANYSQLDFKIKDKSTNALVSTDVSDGTIFLQVQIRHCKDELANEFAEATKDACAGITTAVNLVKSAVTLLDMTATTINTNITDLEVLQAATTAEITALKTIQQSTKDAVDLAKGSMDLCQGKIDLGTAAVNANAAQVLASGNAIAAAVASSEAAIASSEAAVASCEAEVLAAKVAISAAIVSNEAQILASGNAIAAAVASAETQITAAKLSCDAINTSVQSVDTACIAINTSCGQIKASVDTHKIATDAVATAANAIDASVQAHQAETATRSAKIRYRLIN